MTDVAARFVVLLPCLAWRVLDLLEVNRKIATHLSGAKNLEISHDWSSTSWPGLAATESWRTAQGNVSVLSQCKHQDSQEETAPTSTVN